MVQKKTTTHTIKKYHDRLTAEWAKRLQYFLWFDGPQFVGLLNSVTPAIDGRFTNMQEAVTLSQRGSITVCYLDGVNTFEDLKFICARSPQSIAIPVLEMVGWMNIAQYRPQTDQTFLSYCTIILSIRLTQHIVQRFNNNAQYYWQPTVERITFGRRGE